LIYLSISKSFQQSIPVAIPFHLSNSFLLILDSQQSSGGWTEKLGNEEKEKCKHVCRTQQARPQWLWDSSIFFFLVVVVVSCSQQRSSVLRRCIPFKIF